MSRLDKSKGSLNAKEIIFMTNNGIDIIQRYTHLKKYGRKLKGLCPYHSERTPSCIVSPDTGHFICYGCGKTGNAIDLIMDKVGLDFQGALRYIVEDFHLNISQPIVLPEPIKREYKKLDIQFSDKPFDRRHHKYFNQYHLTEEYLKTIPVYAIDRWAINGHIQEMSIDQYSFAYHDEKEDNTKVLSIGVSKENKWRTNVNPLEYIWYLPEGQTDSLIYAKSNKDAIVLKMLGYNSCAATSENSEVSIQVLPKVFEVSDNPILHFGSNEEDAKKTDKILEVFPIRSIVTPKQLLKFECEDISDYTKLFGPEATKRLINKQL